MADEYIRKQDAIDAIHCDITITGRENAETVCKTIASFTDGIKSLKPADVAPVVHAHWIQTSAEDENGNAYYYCSNCGRGESHNPIVEVPYCWKCGAKMDAQGEE